MIIENLKEASVRANNVVAVFPQIEKEQFLDCSWASQYDGCFAINNSTVAFVIGEDLFVTPYTEAVLRTLQAEGFCWDRFYVPFSNWDYPSYAKDRWMELRRKAAAC